MSYGLFFLIILLFSGQNSTFKHFVVRGISIIFVYSHIKAKQNNKTMEAKELRVGNLVNYDFPKGQDFIVIKSSDIETLEEGIENSKNNYKPIPLTEEWLLKFGFNRGEVDYFVYYGDVVIIWYDDFSFGVAETNEKYIDLDYMCSGDYSIQYAHQLQNLYFALTGKELTINEGK